MNREELIEEAANAMVAASEGQTWEDCEQRLYLSDAEAAFAVFEKAQAPTNGERGALPIAPREIWDWDTCVVCGSKEVSDRSMVIMGASKGSPYAARIAWCDQSQECREDLRQTSFLLTEFDANMIDQPEEDKGVTHATLTAAGVTQPEPEYEYRLVLELHPPKHAAWDQAETLWHPTAEEARATGKARDWIAHYRIDYPRAKFTERVERRIVAGEPETAPNQEGQP